MPTVLIWMSPEGGHILPTVKFARDLMRRGYEIVYQTIGRFQQQLSSLGFRCVPFFESVLGDWLTTGCSEPTVDELLSRLASNYASHERFVAAFRSEIARAAMAVGADLVVVDGVYDHTMQLQLQIGLQCPVIRVWVHLPPRPIDPAEVYPDRGEIAFLSPPELELPAWRSDHVCYTEASLYVGGGHERLPESWRDDSRPLVYLSFGSQAHRYPNLPKVVRSLLQVAHRRLDLQFVLSVGVGCSWIKNVGCPANAVLLESALQRQMLEQAATMIHHGGSGSLKECLSYGVPMIVIPQLHDQFSNGMRVEHHRLGTVMENQSVNANSMEHAIARNLSDKELKRQIGSFKQVLWNAELAEPMANLCETVVHGTSQKSAGAYHA
jgi:UDP:flavonoid glycosyltransferase YjiC (YdhE family)